VARLGTVNASCSARNPFKNLPLGGGGARPGEHACRIFGPGSGVLGLHVNAGHAGELFIKAVIAKEHPLLIFRDLFLLDDKSSDNLNIEDLIKRGKTYEINTLPQILWATTGYRIKEIECFERLRKARNAIQHFCDPDKVDLRSLSLEFIYKIVDPLVARYFGICAIEYHEDSGVSYDYVVAQVLRSELRFTMPKDFNVTEISIKEELEGCDDTYRKWIHNELEKIDKLHLYR
jgi:hypothetical protein